MKIQKIMSLLKKSKASTGLSSRRSEVVRAWNRRANINLVKEAVIDEKNNSC